MLALALAGALASAPSASSAGTTAAPITDLTCANLNGARLLSQEADPVYLGFFGSTVASDSVNNTVGRFGSTVSSTSIRNNIGRYGSNVSGDSHANNVATRPPLIVRDGYVMGLLTVNNVATSQDYGTLPRVSLASIDAQCQFNASRPQLLLSNQTGAGGLDISFSGFWWNPARSGEGLLLEFSEIGGGPYLFAVFFTYDPASGAPVYIAGGSAYNRATANSVTFSPVLSEGGRFGPAFNPNDVRRTPWGSMTFTITGCRTGTLTYTSTLPGYGSGSIQVERFLEPDAYTTCP